MKGARVRSAGFALFFICVCLTLYLPIAGILVRAVRAFRADSGVLTELINDADLVEAAWRSLQIASLTTVTASALGCVLAYSRSRWVGSALGALLAIPEIVLGMGFLIFFSWVRSHGGTPLGFLPTWVGHVALALPYSAIAIRARRQGFEQEWTDAARDLGGTPTQRFLRLELPWIMPGVIAAGVFSFALSFDDFVISWFLGAPGRPTLPAKIYAMSRYGISSQIEVLSAVLMFAVPAIAGLGFILGRILNRGKQG